MTVTQEAFRATRTGIEDDKYTIPSQADMPIEGQNAIFIYAVGYDGHLSIAHGEKPVIKLGDKVLGSVPINEEAADVVRNMAAQEFCDAAQYISSCYTEFNQLGHDDRLALASDMVTMFEAAKRRAIDGFLSGDQADALFGVWEASSSAVRTFRSEMPA